MQIGYARVSTHQQDTSLQLAALLRAGVARIVEEKRSGVATRPALDLLLSQLQPGDEVIVYKLDRLARSLVDLMRILARIDSAGATFRSLTEAIETVTPVGRMLTQVLCVIAEFERGLIRERCQAGRVEARNRGIRFGSPPRISRDQVLQLRAEGLTWRKVGARLGCKGDTARLIGTGTYRACDRAAAVEPLASPVAVYRKALACGSA